MVKCSCLTVSMCECGARVNFKGRPPDGSFGDAHREKKNMSNVLEERQPGVLNKYALCTQKQIRKKAWREA